MTATANNQATVTVAAPAHGAPSNGVSALANSSAGKPWEELPNPFGFLPLRDQIGSMLSYKPNQNHNRYATQSQHPHSLAALRTSAVGRDWLGVGFQVGDTLLAATGSGELKYVTVERIVLDQEPGNPYQIEPYAKNRVLGYDNSRYLLLHRSTGTFYEGRGSWRNRNGHASIQEVDSSWISNGLGLLNKNLVFRVHEDFDYVQFQSLQLRARPVNGGRAGYFHQHQVSVPGIDQQLMSTYLEAKKVPLIGDEILVVNGQPQWS